MTPIASIIVLCTTALIPQYYETRKLEYETAFHILAQQPLPVFVVESCLPAGPTYLDTCCKNVFYAHSNNPQFKNKGVNEAVAMLKAIDYFNFDDDTMIIKVTGRYPFNNFDFITLVSMHPEYDVFVRYDNHGQVYTGCFAMRCRQMRKMLAQLNLGSMEIHMINIETEVARYIKHHIPPHKIHSVAQLGITARFFGPIGNLDIHKL